MKIKQLEKIINSLSQQGWLAWTKKVYAHKGAEIFLVGGAVRDALLARTDIKDFDFVVRGWKIDELGACLAKQGKVNLVGKNFGVFKFVPDGNKIGEPFDIALPRTELSMATGGYHDFKINYDEKLPIQEDLSRRDFTVNALAYELKSGKLVDEFSGLKDLKNKVIRTVGNPYERFGEDYSRMLRGIRLVCQLDWQMEKITFKAVQKLMQHINDKRDGERVVPYEIIASELLKAFMANAVKAFDLYDKTGALKELMPELLKMKKCPQPVNWHSEGDVWQHTRLCLKNLQSKDFKIRFKKNLIKDDGNLLNAELIMAVLWHDVGKPYTIQTPEADGTDRIRFNEHDNLGAKIARKKFDELKLSAAPGFSFDSARAAWLIAKHHLFDPRTVKAMKNSTIEKYFFNNKYDGDDLLKLGFIDELSSLWQKNKEQRFEGFNLLLERINSLKKIGKNRKLPPALLNGREVMKILNIKAGIKVGEILKNLREQQLSGKIKNRIEAIEVIRKTKRNLK